MNSTVFLCAADQLEEGCFTEFEVDLEGEPVFLVATRHQGAPKAWYNVCPHAGSALNYAPGRFLTDEHGHLVCASHGAVFEPDQGRCVAGPCKNAWLKAVTVHESDGQVLVQTAG